MGDATFDLGSCVIMQSISICVRTRPPTDLWNFLNAKAC